jgi:hypothetical protein
MLRREKRAQLTKNIIAESERVIEFGEHASYSLGSTAGCAFRDRFCRKPCEVVLDRGNLRIKIGDLPRRWEWQLIKPGCIHRIDRERRQRQVWKSDRAIRKHPALFRVSIRHRAFRSGAGWRRFSV